MNKEQRSNVACIPPVIRVIVVLGAAAAAFAGADSALWSFDLTTTGGDVSWVSPTSVNPNAAVYRSEYEITLVEVDVTWFGIPFNNIDVTDQLSPEVRMGTGAALGPAPLLLYDNAVEFPGPPAPPCLAAQLTILLDAQGFGHFNATSVTLSSCELDIGFGVVTVQFQSVRIVGQIMVDALTCPWDLDASGVVNVLDLIDMLLCFGQPAVPPCDTADVNADGTVNVLDLIELLLAFGTTCP